jgi:hypothetical protein
MPRFPRFCEVAREHGVYVFDPQDEALASPSGERSLATPVELPPMMCAQCGRQIDEDFWSVDSMTGEVMHFECMVETLDENSSD